MRPYLGTDRPEVGVWSRRWSLVRWKGTGTEQCILYHTLQRTTKVNWSKMAACVCNILKFRKVDDMKGKMRTVLNKPILLLQELPQGYLLTHQWSNRGGSKHENSIDPSPLLYKQCWRDNCYRLPTFAPNKSTNCASTLIHEMSFSGLWPEQRNRMIASVPWLTMSWLG